MRHPESGQTLSGHSAERAADIAQDLNAGLAFRLLVLPFAHQTGREERAVSFIITMYVREGIVMASDSRLTLKAERQESEKQVVQMAVSQSDSNYKTFLAPGNLGISTYGMADLQGVPLAGDIESFINEYLSAAPVSVDEVPQALLDHFRRLEPTPDTKFHVAGYAKENGHIEQRVWHVSVLQNQVRRLNPPGQPGASWGGEADILARLIQPVGTLDQDGKLIAPMPYHQIPWQFFTLQDAIDFCIFAVRSTIDAIRFQPRPKTVGGPIDVLVIKPDRAFWVQRKELHGVGAA